MPRIRDLCELIGGELIGDGEFTITGVGSLEHAGPADLAAVDSARFLPAARASGAGAFLVRDDFEIEFDRPTVSCASPLLALNRVIEHLGLLPRAPAPGVDPSGSVEKASLGADVHVGPNVVVEPGAVIGRGTVLRAQCVIEPGAKIGEDCRLDPGVVIHAGVFIGNRVRIGANSVLGRPGFAYVPTPEGPEHIHHLGRVVIGDDTHIGAGCAIDRARFGETRLGVHVKLDNHVHIGHNCVVGDRTVIAAQVGLAGGARVGRDCLVGGQAGFSDHAAVGDHSQVGARASVMRVHPAGCVLWGTPARDKNEHLRELVALKRLAKKRKPK